MDKKTLIAAIVFLLASLISFLASKWAYHVGGMLMDGPASYYHKWGRITDIFGKIALVLLIIGVILLVVYLLLVLKKK